VTNNRMIYPAFLLSGAAMVLYELLWARTLAPAFGGTMVVSASAAGLFILGLSLGSIVGGRLSDFFAKGVAVNLFRLYAALQISAALLACANLLLFPSFALSAGQYRYWAAGALVLAQALPLGAAWPAMVRIAPGYGEKRDAAGSISFINTMGGCAGAVLYHFLLVPRMGLPAAAGAAIALTILSAATVLFSFDKERFTAGNLPVRLEKPESVSANTGGRPRVFALMAVSGFASMGLAVMWLRAFGLLFGSSVYSLAILTAVLLFALATGGLAAYRLGRRSVSAGGLGVFVSACAVASLAGTALLTAYPEFLLWLGIHRISSFPGYTLLQVALVGAVVMLPGILSGIILPYGINLLESDDRATGAVSGAAFSAYTAGAALGGILAAVLVLPSLGLKAGIVFFAALPVVAPLLLPPGRREFLKAAAWTLIAVLAGTLAFHRWDERKMASAVFYYGGQVMNETGWDMVSYRDGREHTVSVTKYRGEHTLRVDGMVEASTRADIDTQQLLGHLPALLSRSPSNALVFGLGSGAAAGALSLHPEVRAITVVEKEPEVARAAAQYFSGVNRSVLDDPRTNVVIDDPREFLLGSVRNFDIIAAGSSNPWMAGAAGFYTREFFELARSRLRDGGIYFQWFHLYNSNLPEVRSTLATFRSVFPATAIILGSNPTDVFLAGSDGPLDIDWNRFAAYRAPGFEPGNRAAGLFCSAGVALGLVFDAELNTDAGPTLEYRAPLGLRDNTRPANLDYMARICAAPAALLSELRVPLKYRLAAERAMEARARLMMAMARHDAGDLDGSIVLLDEALGMDPDASYLKRQASAAYYEKGASIINSAAIDTDFNANAQAEKYLTRCLKLDSDNYHGRIALIYLYIHQERLQEAEVMLRESGKRFPWSGAMLMYKGIVAGLKGDRAGEMSLLLGAYSMEAWNPIVIENLAAFYARQGDSVRAEAILGKMKDER
jgi:spermidine synthase